MATISQSSLGSKGILEQLEEHIRSKIDSIKGLLELRTNEPDEKYKLAFEDVFRTFSEVDELVDTLNTNVEHEKSFVKYVHSILKANESQMLRLKKLAEIVSERGDLMDEACSSDAKANQGKKIISKAPPSNRIPPSRSFKTIKPRTFKSSDSASLQSRNGLPNRYPVPDRKVK